MFAIPDFILVDLLSNTENDNDQNFLCFRPRIHLAVLSLHITILQLVLSPRSSYADKMTAM